MTVLPIKGYNYPNQRLYIGDVKDERKNVAG